MPGLARIAMLATPAMLAVALGACGAQDSATAKNDYVRQLNAARAHYASTAASAAQEITATSSPRSDRRVLERYRGAIGDLIRALRAIKVPDDVRSEHGRLVTASTELRDAISQITVELRAPTTPAIADAERRLKAATIAFNEQDRVAASAINAKLRGK